MISIIVFYHKPQADGKNVSRIDHVVRHTIDDYAGIIKIEAIAPPEAQIHLTIPMLDVAHYQVIPLAD